MIWLDLLRRFWPYLAAAAALIGLAIYLNQAGYKSGYAASEAHWQPLFAAAARARDEANARASVQEARSRDLSDQTEKQHAETIASITSRAADAERSNRSLVRELAARSRCGAVPQAGGPTAVPDAAPAGDELADRVGSDLTELARRCEADASTLKDLQSWVRGQIGILSAER